MISRALFILCLASLTGCASVQTSLTAKSDAVITVISKINNTAIVDLRQSQAVAMAATPPDTDGFNCSAGAITVFGQINAVIAAAKSSPATAGTAATATTPAVAAKLASAPGAFTQAELATIFAPNSPQWNQVKDTITSACAAKVAKVIGAAQMTLAGGVVGVLAGAAGNAILPLAAAAAP